MRAASSASGKASFGREGLKASSKPWLTSELFQAEPNDLLVLRLVLGDAPVEVDAVELDAVGQKLLAERGERDLDDVVAFRVHVAEGRREEHADVPPTGRRSS